METVQTLKVNFFKSYSTEGEKLKNLLEKELVLFFDKEFGIKVTLEIQDSAGLAPRDGNSPFKVLTAVFNNEIVIIDASIEEFEDRKFGVNYDCITPAVSSLDNVLVVSRTQLPLNFVACRTNVVPLGETDKLNPENNNRIGYSKEYSNEQIIFWLYDELHKMHKNDRLIRSDDLKIDITMPFSDIMKKEMEVMDKNMKARQKEKHSKKQIFISYRTYYYNRPNVEENKRHKYKGKYEIKDVVDEIKKYHIERVGDANDWAEPFYFPSGVLSNEFMPEIRRWAFVSYPDRRIRECDEFWIFDTKYHEGDNNKEGHEEGYWDSWWCLGEFMTIVRMKHDGQLIRGKDGKIYKKLWNAQEGLFSSEEGLLSKEEKKEFKVMLFSPDEKDPYVELKFDEIPEMTEEQNKELSRFFVNSDFRQAGLESMATMRILRYLPRFIRKVFYKFATKVVYPSFGFKGELSDITFKDYEESVFSHAYDESFTQGRLLECKECSWKGNTKGNVLKNDNDVQIDNSFIWDFLNISNYFYQKGLYNVKKRPGIVQLTEKELDLYRQNNGDYIIKCKKGHNITIRKSEDKVYLYWTPRRSKYTGPNKCVIETVDLYEIV